MLYKYSNGNAIIQIDEDGTRTIEYDGELKLEYPLNIDIRVQTVCPLGYNPKTGKAICEFCHESATTDGVECNYDELLLKLEGLPQGIELAIGCNVFTDNLYIFLKECYLRGYICNLTVNQLSINKCAKLLQNAIYNNYIKGLGISYRGLADFKIPTFFKDHDNTVIHVIAGIDNIDEVMKLDVRKILVLGEKDFGFNKGKVNLESQNHKEWFWYVRKLFDIFDVVSFDNLALEQLKIKRFLPDSEYEKFYQGEHSFYINAVTKTFSRSSRSAETTPWDISIQEYFKSIDVKDQLDQALRGIFDPNNKNPQVTNRDRL
jgi:hypothetical protein